MAGTSPAMTETKAFRVSAQVPQSRPACFPALLAPNRDREIGGGRATRQPGQVRKEAALTRSGSGRSSVSYLFFERIAQDAASRALRLISLLSASRPRETINCGSTDERRWRSPNKPKAPIRAASSSALPEAAKPYRVLARKYRPPVSTI